MSGLITIKSRTDDREGFRLKRIRQVSFYNNYILCEVCDKQGKKLYNECFNRKDIERMMI